MKNFKKVPVAIAIAAAVVLVGGAALAVTSTVQGTNINKVIAVSDPGAQQTTSTSFVALEGATATVTVPAGKTALILARLTAESTCYGGTGVGWCSVRIVDNGNEMAPVSGADFGFDSTDVHTETHQSWESHSVERALRVGAGTHRISVEWSVTGAGVTFRLDDWLLRVDKAA